MMTHGCVRWVGEKLLCCWTNGFETHVHKYDTPCLAEPATLIQPPYSSLAVLLCTCKRIILSRAASTFISSTLDGLSKCLPSSQRGLPDPPSSNYVTKYWSDFFFFFIVFLFRQLEKLRGGKLQWTFFSPKFLDFVFEENGLKVNYINDA